MSVKLLTEHNLEFLSLKGGCTGSSESRLISVVDVVGPMNPYQPIPFHILSFAVFQSRILIYAGSNEIVEEKKSICEEYGYLVK